MTSVDVDRYARQQVIPGWTQERIGAAGAVVVGVGALGNEVAKNLGLLGIGRVVLCDSDVVAVSNLSRTVLFGAADIDQPKVTAATAALARLAPATAVLARHADLVHGVGLGELADADVVLGCLDSRRARLQLLGRCALVGARLVDGGTHPWGGEVRLRLSPSPDEACYGCSLTAAQRAATDPPVRCDGLAAAPSPASIVSTSLVAAWMTAAAVQIILGQPPPWRFLDIDAATGTTGPIRVLRDDACPHHSPIGPVDRFDVSHTATVDQFLSGLPERAEPLTWAPFPCPGTCHNCAGLYDSGPYDFGRYHDATAACPHCGMWIRTQRSQRLRDAAPVAPLSELGIAPEEILAVRMARGEYRWLRLSR